MKACVTGDEKGIKIKRLEVSENYNFTQATNFIDEKLAILEKEVLELSNSHFINPTLSIVISFWSVPIGVIYFFFVRLQFTEKYNISLKAYFLTFSYLSLFFLCK